MHTHIKGVTLVMYWSQLVWVPVPPQTHAVTATCLHCR